jgi:hypothetical protein
MRVLNAYRAQRIRLGILAARHDQERWRMTADQIEDLESMELAGWKLGDAGTLKAYNRELTKPERKRNS